MPTQRAFRSLSFITMFPPEPQSKECSGDATDLASAVARLRPQATPAEHLRLALLIAVNSPWQSRIGDDQWLNNALLEVSERLEAVTDRHAAMLAEIDSIASTQPCEFQVDHIWTLVRGLGVKSEIVDLYLS